MRMKNRSRETTALWFILTIAVVTAWFLLRMPVFAAEAGETEIQQEEKNKSETVKVAYVILENFQEGAEGELKSGYGYEYLQRIAYYTGWKYEYVYGDFQKCLKKLENGEIDLMANISYTDERAELFHFSDEEQGKQGYYVFGRTDQTKITKGDLSTLDGMNIGVNSGGFSAKLAQEFCEENGLDCNIVEYRNQERWLEAMESGEVDAVITSEVHIRDGWTPLFHITDESYYYGVAKERTDLLSELNDAMKKMKEANPFYNENLRSKYLAHTSIVTETLTDEEKDWILEHPQVTIGYLNNYMPYCSSDEKTGALTGMLKDLMDNIKKEYGLDYQAVSYDSYGELKTALYDGSVDAIFPVYGNYAISEKTSTMISEAATHSTMTMFSDGEKLQDSYTIAVTYSDPFQEKYVEINYPDAAVVSCNNLSECLSAVLDGTADVTVVETAKVNESENKASQKQRIQKTDLQEIIDICFAMKRGNNSLLCILDKGIQVTDNSLINNSLIFYSQKNAEYTVADFFRDHILETFLVMAAVFLVIIGMLVSHCVSVRKSKNKLQDAYNQIKTARWEAAHDTLTGLLNRASFQNLCENMRDSGEPLALLIVDVDEFKQVNDRFGHEAGDRALVKVSNALMQHFRAEDYIIRYAGDEFVVLMSGMTEDGKEVIETKIEEINEKLNIPDYNIPKLSISVGAAFSASGYQDGLFQQADQALYATKENGRCGCSFYYEEERKRTMPWQKNIS